MTFAPNQPFPLFIVARMRADVVSLLEKHKLPPSIKALENWSVLQMTGPDSMADVVSADGTPVCARFNPGCMEVATYMCGENNDIVRTRTWSHANPLSRESAYGMAHRFCEELRMEAAATPTDRERLAAAVTVVRAYMGGDHPFVKLSCKPGSEGIARCVSKALREIDELVLGGV